MITLNINGNDIELDVDTDTPLLWVLRETLQLNGTKFGCGAGLCGACTVLLDGKPIRSCLMPVAALLDRRIETIESLGGEHPVQRAWIEHNVAQCGYCQSGQIMATVALLNDNPAPSTDDIKTALSGNICRCGTYPRILTAIQSVVAGEEQPSTLRRNDIAQVAFFDPAADTGGAG